MCGFQLPNQANQDRQRANGDTKPNRHCADPSIPMWRMPSMQRQEKLFDQHCANDEREPKCYESSAQHAADRRRGERFRSCRILGVLPHFQASRESKDEDGKPSDIVTIERRYAQTGDGKMRNSKYNSDENWKNGNRN
ncbi:hypothetical protein AA103581_0405 [Gluconobacter wancherniae NBRC 103581]|nr:hypothetical protein AA103581_0405 [Gluconobacter wancherniae NBRC 103581]